MIRSKNYKDLIILRYYKRKYHSFAFSVPPVINVYLILSDKILCSCIWTVYMSPNISLVAFLPAARGGRSKEDKNIIN